MYRGEYADLTQCPVCGLSRYKRRQYGGDDASVSSRKRNGAPRKVMWYFPIIPRLRRLFANSKEAELLCWHAKGKGRKNDGKLRHPADSTQWRNFDSDNKPFGDTSVSHSTWPVVLCIYNLPPLLCMKAEIH